MPIRVAQFKGMIPKLHPSQLPEGAGAVCHNYVASSGSLVPFRAAGPFHSLHGVDGELVSGIPAGEVVEIAKPAAPTLGGKRWLCRPDLGKWLRITLASFRSQIDENGGRQTFVHHAVPLTWRAQHTERGLNLFCTAPALSPVIFYLGGPYYFRGPRFMFTFLARPGRYGGPSASEDLPGFVWPQSPVFSSNAIPLIDAANNVYGEFQVVDYSGPVWDEDFMITDYAMYLYYFAAFSCSFRVNLNYTEPRRRHYYFVTSNVDGQDREGPPSAVSKLMVANPGQVLTVKTPHASDKVRLYRSGTGHDADFRLVDEGTWTQYEDPPTPAQDEEIPPFGNWKQSGAASIEAFMRGSVMHPAGFAVAFHGDTVWCSDQFRLHAWPEENSTQFTGETVIALALAGDSVVVFTRGADANKGKVHALMGNDPSQLAKYQLSDTTPLLNVTGLCQVGNAVYWPTVDGLAVCTGNRVEIVTREYFTRADWQNIQPASMTVEGEHDCLYLTATFTPAALPSSQSGDNGSIHIRWETRMLPRFLGGDAPSGGINLRVDLKEELAAVTTFADYEGGPGTWRSRLYEFPAGVTFDFIRVASSDNVRLIATVDGVDQAETVLTGSDWLKVEWPHGRFWTFTLKGEGTISCFEALDRAIAAGQDVNVFTPETTASFRAVRFGYPEPVELGGLSLTCQSAAAVPVRIYAGSAVEAFYSGLVTSGELVRIPVADRVAATEFRVEVDTSTRVDQLVVAREVDAAAGEAIVEGRGGLISPWILRRYVWGEGVLLRSVRVASSARVWMRLYYDDSTAPDAELDIQDAFEHRVVSGRFKRLRFCFVDASGAVADHLVSSVTVATSVAGEAPRDGVHLMNAPAYRSQVYRFAEKGLYSAVQVTADAYPLWLDIYRWGDRTKPAATVAISDDRTAALPWEIGADSTLWEFDLRSTRTGLETRVHGMHLLVKTGVPAADGQIQAGYSGGAAPWLYARWEFERVSRLCSARVETVDGQPVWVQFYIDGAAWGVPLEFQSGREEYLRPWPDVVEARTVELQFFESESRRRSADHRVQIVNVYALRPEGVSGAAVIGDFPWLWREFTFPHTGRFTSAQVVLRSGSVTGSAYLRIRCGAEEVRQEITGDATYALPYLTAGVQWSVSVEADANVKQVVLYAEETVQTGGGLEAHAGPGAPDWLRSRYEWGAPTVLSGVRVESSSYPVTLQATTDAGVLTVTVADDEWTSTGWTAAINRAVFRFTGSGDQTVQCVRVLPQQEYVVGDGLVSLSGLPFYWGIRLRFPQSGAWAGVSVDADAAATVTLSRASGAAYTATASIPASDPLLRRVKGSESLQQALTDPEHGSLWILDVTCVGKVHSVTLVAWQPADAGAVVGVSSGPGIPEWYRTRYRLGEGKVPRSVWVYGDSGLDLYCIGTSVAKETFASGATERRIETRRVCTDLVFDFADLVTADGALVSCEEHVAAGVSGVVVRQADGAAAWRNKVLRFNEPASIGVIRARHASSVRVRPLGGDWVTLAMDADYTAVLPSLTASREWDLDVVHSGQVVEVAVFTRVAMGLDGGVAVWRREGDPFCWLDKRVIVERPVSFAAARVVATGNVALTVRDRTRAISVYSATIAAGTGAFRLPRLDARREWVFDLVAGDGVEIEEFGVSTSMGRL